VALSIRPSSALTRISTSETPSDGGIAVFRCLQRTSDGATDGGAATAAVIFGAYLRAAWDANRRDAQDG
jgi:hypothetical protein